jgi:hypothetical protein
MPLIKQFLPFAQERMGFAHPPKLFFRGDEKNAENPLGRTAHYDPDQQAITVYITGRHPKDVMRSIAHELVHHMQCCNGELEDTSTEPGYAQSDEHMREMERQAYEIGNMCFRDFEDGLRERKTIYYEHLQKGEKKMSIKDWKNNEITQLLSEAWGFKFNTLQEFDEFNEGKGKGYGKSPAAFTDTEEQEDKETKALKTRGALEEEAEEVKEAKKGGKDWHATGQKSGQKGAKDKDTDYSGRGMRKDDESDTDPGDEDDTWRKGKKSKTHKGLNKENLNEDSGEDEAWHEWKNEHADDDHIREIEHHLRALKDDRDYERHGAEHDHDKYEDEGDHDLEEQDTSGDRLSESGTVQLRRLRSELKSMLAKTK